MTTFYLEKDIVLIILKHACVMTDSFRHFIFLQIYFMSLCGGNKAGFLFSETAGSKIQESAE